MPGRKVATSGAWPGSTPKSPSSPGTSTWSTSPENVSLSGETRSRWNVAMNSAPGSGRFGRELLALLDRLFDRAHHVEGRFRQVVVLAFDQALEALDGVGDVDQLAGRAGEYLGDVERLRQEALDLARAGDRELVLFRQLV